MNDLSQVFKPTEEAVVSLVNIIIQYIPHLIAAIPVLILGIAASYLIAKVTKKIMIRGNVDDWARRTGIEKVVLRVPLSMIITEVVRWYLLLLTFIQVANILQLGPLETFLTGFLTSLPDIIVGLLIIIIGLTVASFASDSIKKKDFTFSDLVGEGVYFITAYFTVVLALPKFNIPNDILVTSFNYLVLGISAGIAIAIGLGVGLALKDPIADIINKQYKAMKKK